MLAEVLFVERFAHVGWVAEGRFWDGVVLEADESGVDCFERLVVYSASFSSSLLQGRLIHRQRVVGGALKRRSGVWLWGQCRG